MKHPLCDGNKTRKLCSLSDCTQCFLKSFASSEKSKFWSAKNDTSPRQMFISSFVKRKFDCPLCPHEFEKRLSKITQGHWCPYCSSQELCDDGNCDYCFQKSFASSERAISWSSINEEKPRSVFKSTYTKYAFDCKACSHVFYLPLANITAMDCWCTYCSSKQLCSKDECTHCLEKSFASSKMVSYWSTKNEQKPRNVFKSSHDQFLFVCPDCKYEFPSALNNIKAGNFCPLCKHKTEAKIGKWLMQHFTIVHQPKYDWCKNKNTNRHMPFDFCIESQKIILECDGAQHFEQVSNWDPPDVIQQRDRDKEMKAIANGHTIIRVMQEEVWRDKFDWKTALMVSILRPRNSPTITHLYGGIEKDISA